MGIFEKSIPRYTYDPVQKLRAQPVPEYYVDDIFDPLFNRSVKEALTQKYGNPFLGTVMGYYEGVENALFGQNDEWGILGPGMGILSGFGRSMDKAGDVILGSLTEGVKGITGQGVENPFENIFVEDEDYSGRRALAAMANSMSRFAGGTTVSEEDFGGEFGPVSLGIELATDPSILGSNLTKIAKAPSVAEQLGSADNFLGDVGRFLQQYDDVMAKASIDLTAPGLKPALKALRNRLPWITKTNSATDYTDATREIYDVDLDDDAAVANAIERQKELANDQTLASSAQMDAALAEKEAEVAALENTLEALGSDNAERYLQTVADAATAPLDEAYVERMAQFMKDHPYEAWKEETFKDSPVPLLRPPRRSQLEFYVDHPGRPKTVPSVVENATPEHVPQPSLSDADILSVEAAHEAMTMPKYKLKKLVEDYTNLVNWDIAAAQAQHRKVRKVKRLAKARLDSAIIDRNDDFANKSKALFDYISDRKGTFKFSEAMFADTSVRDVYLSKAEDYLTELLGKPIHLREDNFHKFEELLDTAEAKEDIANMLGLYDVVDTVNPEYAHRIDFSPRSFMNSEFVENAAANNAVLKHLEESRAKLGPKLRNNVMVSPSQLGKLSNEILSAGNEYANTVVADILLKNIERSTFPNFKTAAEFRAAFDSEKVNFAFKTMFPDEKIRKDIVEKLTRIAFPPETIVDNFGKKVPYNQYHRYKDYEELYAMFSDYANVKRMDDPAFGASATEFANISVHDLRRYVAMPWALMDPDTYLHSYSKNFAHVSDTLKSEYPEMIRYYAIGKGKIVNANTVYRRFKIRLNDADLSFLRADVAEYRQALDTIRHSIASDATSSETLFFKDLQKGLEDIDTMYLQPANLDVSRSRYDAQGSSLSLDAPMGKDAEGNTVTLLDKLETDDGVSKDVSYSEGHYASKSKYRDQYAFDSSTLWMLRQAIEQNPQIFKNFKNVEEFSRIMPDYLQFKVLDDAFDFDTYVPADAKVRLQRLLLEDESYSKYQNTLDEVYGRLLAGQRSQLEYDALIASGSESVQDMLDEFENKVLPLAQESVNKGYAPFPSASAAKYNPELYELVSSGTPKANAYRTMLVGLIDDFGFENKKFVGTLHPERFLADKKTFANLYLRQPIMQFDEARVNNVFSNKNLFNDRGGRTSNVKIIGDTGMQQHFVKKTLPKTQKFSHNAFEKSAVITEVRPATAAELAYDPPTPAKLAIKEAQSQVSAFKKPDIERNKSILAMLRKNISDTNTVKTASETPAPKTSNLKNSEPKPKIWHWFTKIKEALAVRANSLGLGIDEAGNRIERATLRTTRSAKLIQRSKDMGVPQATTRDVLKLLTEQSGDVLTGAEFFDEIRRTGIVQASFTDRTVANAAYLRLKHNVDVFNTAVKRSPKDADALTLVTRKMSNGNLEVKVMFNTKNKRIAEQIRKNAKALASAKFDDVTFLKARALTTEEAAFLASDDAKRVVEYLNEVNEMSRDQARMLGFTFNESAVHNKHVRNVDPITANYIANDIYNGIDLDSIDEIGVVLSNLDEFRQLDRGVFGAQLQGRRFRGAYWNYDTKDASLFTNDLEKIAKGSLGDGMFANSNFQSFVDFFVNDNFKIHGVFEDVDDIRKFLYAGGSEGLYAGNLKNIDLCVPKYDSNGRIIGIHRFDQYSDTDLAKALANPDTILVPANTIDTLDKVIRKEIRLSNKAYAFFNKHFTIPFKFGVLTNPGFLVGNLNDAYLKQAVTMSEKYGTDVSTELAKVGEAATMYLNLGNSFNAVVEKWIKHMQECGLEVSGAETIPEILAGHGPTRRRLMEYLNGTLKDAKGSPIVPVLNSSEKGTVLLWTKLQQIQHTSNSLREFDDFAEAFGNSDYDVPRNIVDRILQGSGKYNRRKPLTWGVITNNPVSRAAMNASEFIENTMRGTAIFNDLMHAGYTKEQIFKILLSDGSAKEFADAKLVFDVDYANAVNAMYEANFNYERMSDFMEGVGKAMPFPTFFLKNLTYWLTLFEKNPQFFDHAITVHESMWQDRDTSEDEVLAETKGRGAVPVSVPEGIDNASGQKLSKWFRGMFKPTPLQSMFGAFSLLNDPVEDLSYRLHPAISGSAQVVNQALPHNPLTTFLGEAKYRPYSTDIYERNVTQDDEEFSSLAFAAHRANPYERAVGTHLRTPNKTIEGQAQLSDFLPSIFQPDFSKK